jgi:hypothetical protein
VGSITAWHEAIAHTRSTRSDIYSTDAKIDKYGLTGRHDRNYPRALTLVVLPR